MLRVENWVCTALQAASCWGNLQMVELLIEKGADVNAASGELPAALTVAVGRGYVQVANLLRENGARTEEKKKRERKFAKEESSREISALNFGW